MDNGILSVGIDIGTSTTQVIFSRIVMENMYAFKRAGANIIISYHALDVADWLGDGYEY